MCLDLRNAQIAAEQVALVSLLCGQQLAHTVRAMPMRVGGAVAYGRQRAGVLLNEFAGLLLPEQIAKLIVRAGAGQSGGLYKWE